MILVVVAVARAEHLDRAERGAGGHEPPREGRVPGDVDAVDLPHVDGATGVVVRARGVRRPGDRRDEVPKAVAAPERGEARDERGGEAHGRARRRAVAARVRGAARGGVADVGERIGAVAATEAVVPELDGPGRMVL